ncbi:Hypothetical protein, putative [Bodo saltans]|uniref:Uncharacterized protein n=1 Tax=Bodo saltans TaxID=75058 RepID=A0A0S4JCX7_BODSA|nr:Hypothetical protein, putative [Bodo saltans]|eukprot:CUG87047.1 Hypothetical protein, putative [Bodo saltans]
MLYLWLLGFSNKGLIHQLKMLAHRNRIFDADGNGVFVTTLLPDKQARFMAEFKRETDEIRAKAREAVEESKRRREAAGANDEEEAPDAIPVGGDDGVVAGSDMTEAIGFRGNKVDGAYDVVEIIQKERFEAIRRGDDSFHILYAVQPPERDCRSSQENQS